jgi:hypothetical protein
MVTCPLGPVRRAARMARSPVPPHTSSTLSPGSDAEHAHGGALPGVLDAEAEQRIHEIVFGGHPVEVDAHRIGLLVLIEFPDAEAGFAGGTNVFVQLLLPLFIVKPAGVVPEGHEHNRPSLKILIRAGLKAGSF